MKKTMTLFSCEVFEISTLVAQNDTKTPAKKDEAKKEAPAKKDDAKKADAKKAEPAKKDDAKKADSKDKK